MGDIKGKKTHNKLKLLHDINTALVVQMKKLQPHELYNKYERKEGMPVLSKEQYDKMKTVLNVFK